jgi:hypothetical protein
MKFLVMVLFIHLIIELIGDKMKAIRKNSD